MVRAKVYSFTSRNKTIGMNTFGRMLRLTSFGESHGVAIGGVLDGMPSGVSIDIDKVQQALDRRRPGQSMLTTQRKEADRVEILSGIYQGHTLGTPIGFVVRNTDQRSEDYDALAEVYRPSHADYTYQAKYGCRDPRGGGRASARETVVRVVAGSIAAQLLGRFGIEVVAYTSAIGPFSLASPYVDDVAREQVERSLVRCPDEALSHRMAEAIVQVKGEGDSLGGVVSCIVRGVPVGLGEPIYDKLSARLAEAMLSINAARAFELGDGWEMTQGCGSNLNDAMTLGESGGIVHTSNHSGGILGGISNGEVIRLRVGFKPTATIAKAQQTIDWEGRAVELAARGRHDPCVVPRAVPVVEAMVNLVIADFYLLHRSGRGGSDENK